MTESRRRGGGIDIWKIITSVAAAACVGMFVFMLQVRDVVKDYPILKKKVEVLETQTVTIAVLQTEFKNLNEKLDRIERAIEDL